MKKFFITVFIIFFGLISTITVNADDIGYISDYVFLYDLDSGQILIDKGSTEKIYPASMTKMMTLLVAIENINDYEKTVLITEETLAGLKEAHASRAGFDVGDEPKIIDLLYGVNLPSGADCTNALAYYVSGSLEEFVKLMNQKALEIGMNDTNFVNVTGLHNDNHYSTLRDIAKLMEYGLKNEMFRQIFTSEKHTSIPVNSNPDGLKMVSTVMKYINKSGDDALKYNVLIPGFYGGKSGYTGEARYCLASVIENNGVRYALITAHAWEKREIPSNVIDAGLIYNYYLNNYHKEIFYNKDDVILNIPVKYNFNYSSVDVLANEEISRIIKNNSNIEVKFNVEDILMAPINVEDSIGTLDIIEDGQIIYSSELYPSRNINKQIIAFILISIFDFVLLYKFKIIALLVIFIMLTVLIKKMIEKA